MFIVSMQFTSENTSLQISFNAFSQIAPLSRHFLPYFPEYIFLPYSILLSTNMFIESLCKLFYRHKSKSFPYDVKNNRIQNQCLQVSLQLGVQPPHLGRLVQIVFRTLRHFSLQRINLMLCQGKNSDATNWKSHHVFGAYMRLYTTTVVAKNHEC